MGFFLGGFVSLVSLSTTGFLDVTVVCRYRDTDQGGWMDGTAVCLICRL